MSALVSALIPALRQVARDKAKREADGTTRKRRWRDDPANRAIENERKRERYANRSKPK